MARVLKGLTALVLTGVLGLCGCISSESSFCFGRIVRKEHEPAERYVKIYRLILSDGRNTEIGKIPIYCDDNEDDVVYVSGDKGEFKVYVIDKKVFEKLKIGDELRYNYRCMIMYDPMNKRRLTQQEYDTFLKNKQN